MIKFEGKMEEIMERQTKHLIMAMLNTNPEAMKIEQDPGMMQSMDKHQEIPTQDATVMPVREPRKQRRVQNLAVESRRERKDRTQGIHGSRRKVSGHARVAWRKRNITRKIRIQENSESSKDFAADGMRKGPGCENAIRRWDVKEPPYLTTGRKTATSIRGWNKREQPQREGLGICIEIFWKTFGLHFMKQVVEMSSGLLQIRIWTLWRG
jgi:hypothetical protein